MSCEFKMERPEDLVTSARKIRAVIIFIHPKYYKHLKKGAHQSHLGEEKNELVFGRLSCTSSKTEMLNNIGI